MFQTRQLSTNWLVRSDVDPKSMERQVRAAVHALDPDQPVDHFRTLAEVRSASLAPPRLTAALLGLVRAARARDHGRRDRRRDRVLGEPAHAGVRHPHGARRAPRRTCSAWCCARDCSSSSIGLAIGLAGALVLTRVLSTLLFGVQPTDGLTYLAVSMVLVAVAAIACVGPGTPRGVGGSDGGAAGGVTSGFTGSRVHGFTGSRVHGFRVHGFTGSRVRGSGFSGSD